jgi:uncharacterized LabA/DUF88 family protein
MDKIEIKKFLENQSRTADSSIVIIDFSNVDKWRLSLGWDVGIRELGQLIKHLAIGKKYLRRFYYGEDYGPNEKNLAMTEWSRMVHEKAHMSGFEIITKRVKYIPDSNYSTGYISKCNLDVEMAVDLVKEADNYENIFLFSGDGDMAYVLTYLKEEHNKNSTVFCARNHIGKELIDAVKNNVIKNILFVEDFEYRLRHK